MLHLGDVPANSVLYIPFHTFNSSGASVTMTGFAVTDILIYKNGSITQRASTNGYTLLDTDGTDFDGITGIHGFSIDLSDNSDAGFYAAGSWYWVVISSVTVDSQTVNFVAATFRIVAAEGTSGTPSVDVVRISNDATAADNCELFFDGTGYNASTSAIGTAANVTTVNGLAANVITAASIADSAIDRAAFAADTGLQAIRSNTAQAGSSTTITLDASASATNDFYKHAMIYLTGGTGAGQYRLCTTYNGTTKVATVTPAWTTNPDATSTFAILALGIANLEAIGGAVLDTSSAQLGVNVVKAGGTAWGSGAITAGVFAADAIGAAAIAPNAIGASELAADAVTEIQTGLSTLDAAGVRAAVGLAAANLDAQLTAIDDYLDTEVAAIKAKTDNLPASPAAVGSAMTLTSAYDVYHADIQFTDDDVNAQDEYTVTWFKNGVRQTTGITSPTIQVVKRADGSDLVASSAMTQIGTTGSYKYDETTNRVVVGEAYLVIVSAVIDGGTRTFSRLISRDS